MVANWTGDRFRLAIEEKKRLVNMDEEIHKRLIGQDSSESGISGDTDLEPVLRPRRPIGSFIFGTVGSRKTELGKHWQSFWERGFLITLDMSNTWKAYHISINWFSSWIYWL